MDNGVIKVLLVEDDDARFFEIAGIFSRMSRDCYLVEASSPSAAIETAESGDYDIIVLNAKLSETGHFKILFGLKEKVKDTPIIILSDEKDPEVEVVSREAGADEFLAREDVTPEKLDAIMRSVIRKNIDADSLRASEELYRSLVKSSPIGIWHISSDGQTRIVNDSMCELLEVKSIRELEGVTYHRFFTEESQKKIETESAKRESGVTSSYEATLIGKKGTKRNVVISGGPLYSSKGEFRGMIGAFTDITERKKAEAALLEEKEKAENATKLKDKFVILVAHDLRDPLSNMLSYLRFILSSREKPLPDEAQNYLNAAITSGKNMLTLIKNLLDSGRLKTGKLKPKKSFFSSRLLAIKVISHFNDAIQAKGIEVEKEFVSDCRIYGDYTLLEQVLQNLFGNAVKFCSQGEKIKIRITKGEYAEIGVVDTGAGIPPERLETIFNYETKTSTTGTAGEVGSGMGLPLCKDIIEAHDGALLVESQAGKGSSFTARIPLVSPAALVIENENGPKETIADCLKTADVMAANAENGEEAFKSIENRLPDIVILNLDLIGVPNLQKISKELKSKDGEKDIPIIAYAENTGKGEIDEALKAGAAELIGKPAGTEPLASRIQFHIG